jgi:hypothetical protein
MIESDTKSQELLGRVESLLRSGKRSPAGHD